MLEAGFVTSKSDDCLFILRGEDGVAKGFAGWHVDDGLLTGDADFWKIMNDVVAKKLEFGKRAEKDFKFCGMQVTQDKDGSVRLNQQDQTKHLEEIPYDKKRSKLDPCTPEEITKIRGRVGAILYITGMTRPFEAYRVSHIASWATKACVYHLQLVNELVRDIRDKNPDLGIEYKGGCSVDYMYTFHDSSFKQERESGSQMGILSFVGPQINSAGEIRGASLLRWASKRARRVCHSTLAAETLAATAGLDSQAGLQFRMEEFGFYPKSILLTDCKSLFDHVYAMTGKTAEILLPDIHELREAAMPWRSALSDDYVDRFLELWWCSTNVQMADHLTKKDTPSSKELLDLLTHGIIRLGKNYLRPRSTQRAHSFGTAKSQSEFSCFDFSLFLHELHVRTL